MVRVLPSSTSPVHSVLPPKHVDVLVIGGGPAGSYAASALSLEGIQVAVLESAKFPRYHIGESLIPSIRPYLRFIGAEEKVADYGFTSKPGSAIKFNQFKREGYTDFVALGLNNNAWNVIRSEFDDFLLKHARSCGASVFEETKVTGISFSPEDPMKPISVSWTHTPSASLPTPPSPHVVPAPSTVAEEEDSPQGPAPAPISGVTTFSHLIDASGRAGILSTKYLKNRHFNASLKNIAVWGYWTGVGKYGVGTPREGAPWFEALTDESGWAWFIPLHNDQTSVGIVMNVEQYNGWCKRSASASSAIPASTRSPFQPSATPNPSQSTLVSRYVSNLSLAPGLVALITENGKMVEGSVKSASDFSYSAPSYAGTGYRIVGDAGAFIDPFFSSGIHLALTGALSAAATICASIRNDCSEEEAMQWHTKRVATSYTRFQVVVLSAYKQMRAQNVNVLSDIDEDNFDRAFTFLRPVIQGASDMGCQLSESELQKSLDFCVNIFNPTAPEQHKQMLLKGKVGKELLDVTAPVMNPTELEAALRHETSAIPAKAKNQSGFLDNHAQESDDKMVLDKINARRLVHSEYEINNLEYEQLGGYVARLNRGRLGLVKV